ncbi:MAG: GNAT family N-acetyltransferase [Anaerolineae bacterium]|nr:GNAT family N-acetyltransferase [Gemmatimonadaceae bacterium]
MTVEIRLLGTGDANILARVGHDVFDGPVDPRWTAEFLADPRHHLAIALDAGCVVGMASALHYVHPDKAPDLWINEVGVASTHRSQGIGRRLLDALLEHGRTLGCREAWVLTDETNAVARRLYSSAGGVDSPAVMYTFELDIDDSEWPDGMSIA